MRFFFYGTLIAGSGNAVERAVHRHLVALGPATAEGTLWAISDAQGWYPALVPGAGRVRGVLYEALAGFGAAELALLDGWEGCVADDPAGSDYCRQALRVVPDGGGPTEAQAYVWNRGVPAGAELIAAEDFAQWLRVTGRRPYGAVE